MDCSTGNFFILTHTSQDDIVLEAENFAAGQTINLKVDHATGYSGSLSFDSQFEFVDGEAFEVCLLYTSDAADE